MPSLATHTVCAPFKEKLKPFAHQIPRSNHNLRIVAVSTWTNFDGEQPILSHHTAGDDFRIEESRQSCNALTAWLGSFVTALGMWILLSRSLHAILKAVLSQPGTGESTPPVNDSPCEYSLTRL